MTKVLITSSRMPFAVDMIRKLGSTGHEVHASDSFAMAGGSRSKYLKAHITTRPPEQDPQGFVQDVAQYCEENGIDVVIPAFEEAFYLAAFADRIPAGTRLYTGDFPTLARLHDKGTFQALCQDHGLPTPETAVASSDQELSDAIDRFGSYFARAAFSRGGVSLLTNTGPIAGRLTPEDVHPTPEQPWLVQPFVEGPMICTYSTFHEGKVTAHCTYSAPRQWRNSTGIEFLSIDGEPSLEILRGLAEALNVTGQLSFDFVDSPEGLMLIECNPRPTDGVLLMTEEQLSGGLLDPDQETQTVPAGKQVELDFAVFAQMFADGVRKMPGSIHDLAHTPDSGHGWHDHLPTLYSFLSLAHFERISHREHSGLFEAMADGMVWNGEDIPGLSEEYAEVIRGLHGPAGS